MVAQASMRTSSGGVSCRAIAFDPMRWDGDHWFWAATNGAAAVVLGLLVFAHPTVDPNTQVAPAPNVATAEASRQRTAVSPDRIAPPSATTAPDNTIATVYECDSAGQRTFSDRRCAPNAHERAIEAPSRMDPVDMVSDPVTVEYQQPVISGGEAVVDNASRCAQIQAEIDLIDARMRQGYSSAEGEYLRGRRRDLSNRYYDLRCRHSSR